MTEIEKMFAGKIYDPFSEGMPEARRRAHELCQRYNQIPESDTQAREAILRKLMPNRADGVYPQGPIQFDFGTHITMGKGSYANFNFIVLDENRVSIGEDVFIAQTAPSSRPSTRYVTRTATHSTIKRLVRTPTWNGARRWSSRTTAGSAAA